MNVVILALNRNHLRFVEAILPSLRAGAADPTVLVADTHEFLGLAQLADEMGLPVVTAEQESATIRALARSVPRSDRHDLAGAMVDNALRHLIAGPAIAVTFNDIGRIGQTFVSTARNLGAVTVLVQDGLVVFERPTEHGVGEITALDRGYLTSGVDYALTWGVATAELAAYRSDDATKSVVVGAGAHRSIDVAPEPGSLLLLDQCFVRYRQLDFEPWALMMSEWVEALADDSRLLTIRPHPSQDERCRDFLAGLARDGAIVVGDTSRPLIDDVGSHERIAGFYSTSVFEAVLAGRPTLVLDDHRLPMWLPPVIDPLLRRYRSPSDLRRGAPVPSDSRARPIGDYMTPADHWGDTVAATLLRLLNGVPVVAG